ncbi:hypothetical protein [Moorena sp. SIO4G3]|nr:hypothetical protein [Moorena sp. SIO4G3]
MARQWVGVEFDQNFGFQAWPWPKGHAGRVWPRYANAHKRGTFSV